MFNFFNWEFIFSIGKKNFNLALGMGPNIGPVRALEKGLEAQLSPLIETLDQVGMKVSRSTDDGSCIEEVSMEDTKRQCCLIKKHV